MKFVMLIIKERRPSSNYLIAPFKIFKKSSLNYKQNYKQNYKLLRVS